MRACVRVDPSELPSYLFTRLLFEGYFARIDVCHFVHLCRALSHLSVLMRVRAQPVTRRTARVAGREREVAVTGGGDRPNRSMPGSC